MTQPIIITGCEQEPHQHHWIGDTCSECGVAWNIWIERDHERLKAKLQQAEAAASEIRMLLLDAFRSVSLGRVWTVDTRKVAHALSTTCGVGWLSPEAVEAKLSNYKITDAARQETIAALREKVHTLTGALETAQSKLDRYAIEHPAICYQCGAEVKKP